MQYSYLRDRREIFHQEIRNNSVGIPVASLLDELVRPGPGEDPKSPPVYGILNKVFKPHYQYIHDHWEAEFKWHNHWHYLPIECFDGLTTDEKSRLIWRSGLMSELSEEFTYNPRYQIFHKINNGLWHWGPTDDYNVYVDFYNAIRSFDWGLPGFEVYLDHTTSCNDFGYAQYSYTFLDGTFGYLVHYKGKHVLTIGFSVSRHGVLVPQIQLKEKKGNRWAFKLPMHYFDYALSRMALAFQGFRMWLADGPWLASKVRRTYGRNADKFSKEQYNHIVKMYKRRLVGFRRCGWMERNALRFHRLIPRQLSQVA